MSDRFHPISMEQLCSWVFGELAANDSLFGVPRSAFYRPGEGDRWRTETYGQRLETPFGVAAGPHSQMAQNLLVAWACGARFLELKTVQTLDELEVNKPCIDLQDEGYNVEWSQELKVFESYDEYLRAWVLIHALHRKLGLPGESPGMIFNMSVGYDLAGIQRPNVQWFLDAMDDCSAHRQAYVDIVAGWCPEVREIAIPDRISDSVTLSTMHGCPPGEIEAICTYLLTERGLHTSVKCNPTLLGPDEVRGIVNRELGYEDVVIPDRAFEHDLKWEDALPMLGRLRQTAEERGLVFGVKLTNTLEVENHRQVFANDDTMYMSGRALHALTVNLAARLAEELDGKLLMSFAGGADCFNVAELLASGMATVTVCSDLLKSGGYMRLLQYFETLEAAMDEVGARNLADFIVKRAERDGAGDGSCPAPALANLRRYARAARSEWRSRKDSFRTERSKTPRELGLFDCIEAPCVDECPVDQKVPQYMGAVRAGDFARAIELTREDNPLPAILGRVCDHLCENTCIRTHYDEPLAIREIKRFIMAQEADPTPRGQLPANGRKAAVIGAGPAGLSAAQRLAEAGVAVTIYEMHPYAGGMVGGAIPVYRLPQAQIDQDLRILERLGVEIRYGEKAGVDFTLEELRREGAEAIFVAVGAQLAKRLGLPGEDSQGVMDALRFLRGVREGEPPAIGRRVGVIGAGDTAMDCARSAFRLGSEVSIIYRRTIDQMPADREEIRGALEEGIEIVELASPKALRIEEGRLAGLVCARMEYRGDRDRSGRKIPHPVEGCELDIPLDTLILAISQHAILDFFGDEEPRLNARGYLEVDPESLETSVAGVWAGGDAAADGPSSIVRASADGKRVAASILRRLGLEAAQAQAGSQGGDGAIDLPSLLVRRARRAWRVPIEHSPLATRRTFDETIHVYTPEQAMAEASRCLDCHTICSLCVGVCPNLALMTWRSTPLALGMPRLKVVDGAVEEAGAQEFRAEQGLQIAVVTDFCNECGNCTTFCPTAGEPYRDKPRLYLDRADFEAQADNAFMLLDGDGPQILEARWAGETHRLELDVELLYSSPSLEARLEPDRLTLLSAEPGPAAREGQEISLEPAATMYALLKGLADSMPFLPKPAAGGTRIGHPGYEE